MAYDTAWAKGHFWTIADNLRDRARPPRTRPFVRWSAALDDPPRGSARISGALSHVTDDAVAVVVHGLGGSADSGYVVRMANALHAGGLSTLRLNLRGADRQGNGIYHAGLSSDLIAALSSPELERYRRHYVVAFSMGGHMAIRATSERPDLADALVTICSPLDLPANCRHLDHPLRSVYRAHVLVGLREIYSAYADRALAPERRVKVEAIRTIRDWDEQVVAPHFGFAGADDYYEKVGAGPLLAGARCRTLVIATSSDPMIPRTSLEPFLAKKSAAVAVDWVEGGHVGFPPRLGIASRIAGFLQKPSQN